MAIVEGLGCGEVMVVCGNPRSASKTFAFGQVVAAELATRIGLSFDPLLDAVDLADHGPDLLNMTSRAADLRERARSASLLLLASPVYKGSYTGLLKLFLDGYPNEGLAGTLVVPIMVAGSEAHSLALVCHFMPLLAELRASTPAPGLFVLDQSLNVESHDGWVENVSAVVRSYLCARIEATS